MGGGTVCDWRGEVFLRETRSQWRKGLVVVVSRPLSHLSLLRRIKWTPLSFHFSSGSLWMAVATTHPSSLKNPVSYFTHIFRRLHSCVCFICYVSSFIWICSPGTPILGPFYLETSSGASAKTSLLVVGWGGWLRGNLEDTCLCSHSVTTTFLLANLFPVFSQPPGP